MKRTCLIAIAAYFAVLGTALAQDNPVKKRQELMKANGDAMKVVVPMIKGEKPYDSEAAAKAMSTVSGSIDEFVTLFPDDSKPASGAKTYAKPEVWDDKANFDSKAGDAKEATAKAAEAASGGLDSFKTAFGAVGQSCKACHEKYRREDD